MRKICLLLLLTLLILPCAYAKSNDTVFLDAKDTSINLKPEQTEDVIKNVEDIKVNAKSNEKYLLKNKVEVPMEPYAEPMPPIDPVDNTQPVDPVRELMKYGARIKI